MRILAVTGSSGGHIFPAMSFLDCLKNKYKDSEILLVLPRKNIIVESVNFPYPLEYLLVSSIKLKLNRKNISAGFNFLKSFFFAFLILSRFKPDVVVGFGSLISLPIISWAWVLRIPTVLHEQNVIPGLANRVLAVVAERIAVSFKETSLSLENCHNKIIVTGNPLRQELKREEKSAALDFFGFKPSASKFTVLVMGGSQGAQRINLEFIKFVAACTDKSGLQIIHLCGKDDFEALKLKYRDLNVSSRVFSFLKQMEYAYSAADLAVCRSGATTIFELGFFKLPAIFIPYPYAYRHQLANARVFQDLGAAIIIEEDNLSPEALNKEIAALKNDRGKLLKMRSNLNDFIPSPAAELLVETVVSFN